MRACFPHVGECQGTEVKTVIAKESTIKKTSARGGEMEVGEGNNIWNVNTENIQ